MTGFYVFAIVVLGITLGISAAIGSFWPFLGGVVIVSVCYVFARSGHKDEIEENERMRKEKYEGMLAKVKEQISSPSNIFVNPDLSKAIAIDEQSKRISIAAIEKSAAQIFEYKDIFSVEIIEDGVTVTRTSRSSQVLGAVVGGALLGGVGMVIGGLSAEAVTSNTVTSVELKLLVNDTHDPLRKFIFFNNQQGTSKNSPEYKEAVANANHWHAIISVLIKQAEREDDSVIQKSNVPVSTADELNKWVELLENGHITKEEFDAQKAKLLA